MKVGFIGLGNVGGKLAGSLLRNGHDVTVRDLDPLAAQPFLEQGAQWADSPRELAEAVDMIITCLPSPAACSAVMESDDGIIAGLCDGKIWLEMSTTDDGELRRIAALVLATGARALEAPVSGGCHRAATGNISIFVGGDRESFEQVLPVLTTLGRRVLHTGELGTASVLKVMTNYLATANLCAVAEALTVCKKAGLDMNTTFEAIKISSGNSFVHETESQVILNGSRNISFTMDLVLKDVGLFDTLARNLEVPLEISPLLMDIFRDGQERFGPREWSSNIIRRLEESAGVEVLGKDFPAELSDDEAEEQGYEVVVAGRSLIAPASTSSRGLRAP